MTSTINYFASVFSYLVWFHITVLHAMSTVHCCGCVCAAPEVLDYVSLDSACDMWYVLHFCSSFANCAFLNSLMLIGRIDAAYSYTHCSVICLSVCLLDATMCPTKTAEPIKMLFVVGLGWAQTTMY